ncbi:MAG: YigZ family protein [Caldilineaceae bacterium]|nr:YigZ family protein [Caldilineaceae bacterium]MCB9136946.1 YigZ family protein [Caldilineaceae bacterium]
MSSAQRYPIPAGRHRIEEVINRSRFITTVAHTPTVEDARAFIREVSEEFGDASHNCWAYVAGPPGSSAQIGMSDDGEPHGTAGKPMLTVLLHADVGEISAVVTRYFGGVLLGKGGLVRAYSGGVQNALASMPRSERVPTAALAIVLEYGAVTPFQRLLPDFEAVIENEEYGVDVTYRITLPVEHADNLIAAVTELTNGQALIEPML